MCGTATEQNIAEVYTHNMCVVVYVCLHVYSCVHKGLYGHMCTGGGQRLMLGVFLSGSST